MGPRQMIASSSFCWKKPIDMTLTPKRSDGSILLSWPTCGRSATFIARTTLGQSMSTSRMPTLCPSCARVAARFTATVVLPTPPLAAVHANLVADLRQRAGDLPLLLELASHRFYALARVRLLLRIHSHGSSLAFQSVSWSVSQFVRCRMDG